MNASDDTRTSARPSGRRMQRLAVAALALCMAAGGAMAQGRHDDDRRGPPGHGERFANGHDNRRSDRDHRHDHYDRQDFRDGRHFDRRGYEPRPAEWRRGGRLPPEYRGRNYVVNDYRVYRLQPPPPLLRAACSTPLPCPAAARRRPPPAEKKVVMLSSNIFKIPFQYFQNTNSTFSKC